MPTPGKSDAGFYSGTYEEHRAIVELGWLEKLGQNIDTTDESPYGQLIAIQAYERWQLYQLLELVYNARDPDRATGDALDILCRIIGVNRLAASSSTVTVTLTGTPAATIPLGTLFEVPTTGVRFSLDSAVVLSGAGTGNGTATATATGPLQARAATLTAIVNPVSGLTSVTNAADATLGRNIETDPELRVRRLQAISTAGTGTPDAILAELVAMTDVQEAILYDNPGKTTDANGLPASSFEAVILLASGGSLQRIAEKIWANKGAGIEAHGADSYTVIGGDGKNKTVKFSQATSRNIYMEVVVTRDSREYPADGDEQILAALLAKAATDRGIGKDVVWARLLGAAANACTGINDITLEIGFTAESTGTTNLTIEPREVPSFDSSRISIT